MGPHSTDFFDALVSLDASFDFSRNILNGIQRTDFAERDPSLASALLSPLTPLTPSLPTSPQAPEAIALGLPLASPELLNKGANLFPKETLLPSVNKKTETVPTEAPASAEFEITPVRVTAADSDDTCTAADAPPRKRAKKNKSANKKARDKLASHRHRKKKKDAQGHYVPNNALAGRQVSNSTPTPTTFHSQALKIASTGFVGVRTKKKSKTYFLEDVAGPKSKYNLKLIEWNGRMGAPILDGDMRIMGVCAGVPKDANDWTDVTRRAASLLEEARGRLIFDKDAKKSRRGKFSALNVGISHGGGQPRPMVLDQDIRNASILEELMEDESFRRISGFATGAFASWAPRLYQYQNDCLTALINKDEELRRNGEHPNPCQARLRRNWPKTPWAAAALNFGPQTICFPHADYGNLAYGWCCITALGNYDYRKGGHLILWDLGLIIEFPPGATILIPSSAIEHSNVQIQSGETRYSVTQYSPGGLFRWAANDFQTVDQRRSTMTPDEIASTLQELSHQLEFGLSLFSTVEELERMRKISISSASLS